MHTGDEVVEIDTLERSLLSDSPDAGGYRGGSEADDDAVLYTATFDEMEEKFVDYQTSQWVMYSLVFVLVWGLGLFMLLYLPVRRYIKRKDIRSRKLYLTSNAIVYKVTKPVPFPFFGVLKREKHVLLPSVQDVIIEQGYWQSLFGVYSLRIENVGVRRPRSDDFKIEGIANPSAFKKAILNRLSFMRSEVASRQVSAIEDLPSLRLGGPSSPMMSPLKTQRYEPFPNSSDLLVLQKLEEVGNSVKRVQHLIQEQQVQKQEPSC